MTSAVLRVLVVRMGYVMEDSRTTRRQLVLPYRAVIPHGRTNKRAPARALQGSTTRRGMSLSFCTVLSRVAK